MILDFKNRDFLLNPYPHFERMRRSHPLYYDAENQCWIVLSAEVAKSILSDQNKFTISKKNISGISSDDNIFDRQVRFFSFELTSQHLFLRKSFTSFFTPAEVKKIRPRAEKKAIELLYNLSGETDLAHEYFDPFVVAVATDILGIEDANYKNIIQMADYVSHALYFPNSDKDDKKWTFGLNQLRAFVTTIIKEKKYSEGGLLAHMIDLQNKGLIEEKELLANAVLFLTLTNDNSRHGMANVCWHLLKNKTARDNFESAESSSSCIDELLRMDSPMNALQRFAVDDTTFLGHSIKRGDKIILLINAINYDELWFENPYQIDFSRSKNNFAFGYSTHFCLGYHLGKMEIEIALKILFNSRKEISLLKDQAQWVPVLGIRKQAELRIRLG